MQGGGGRQAAREGVGVSRITGRGHAGEPGIQRADGLESVSEESVMRA